MFAKKRKSKGKGLFAFPYSFCPPRRFQYAPKAPSEPKARIEATPSRSQNVQRRAKRTRFPFPCQPGFREIV